MRHQPGGLRECSRGLRSAATIPPVTPYLRYDPEGVAEGGVDMLRLGFATAALHRIRVHRFLPMVNLMPTAVEARGRPELTASFLASRVTARLVAPLRRVTRGAWSLTTRFLTSDLSTAGFGLGDRAGAFDGGWFLRFHGPTVGPPLQGHNTPLAKSRRQLGLVPA